MKSSVSKLSRRHFLFAISTGGAVATAAVIAGKARETQPKKQREETADTSGYRLTEHIQNYYRTTKV
jgi:hypothetical protein